MKTKNKRKKKDIKIATLLLFLITLFVWSIFFCIKYFFWGVELDTLLDEIFSNILGILPPIIIFNFAYEYLTKEHIAEEMSEQITSTLMSDPESIDLFDDENKLRFIKTTIGTIVDKDSLDMVYGVVEPYVTNQYNVRKSFKYNLTLRDYLGNPLFPQDKYMKVYQNLKYTKLFINEESAPREFHIGFFVKDHALDRALRNNTYLFRENLIISQTELQSLVSLSEQDKLSFIQDEIQLRVYIDSMLCQIKSYDFSEDGIDILFESNHSQTEKKHSVEISFGLPHRKQHSEILAAISEPTYSPSIQLSYPESLMNVRAFSFMNDGEESLLENASHYAGGYEFSIQDKWIYPMSGVVFTFDEKRPEETDV